MVVSPTEIHVEPGKKQTFVAKGLDQYGHEINTGAVAWRATGGSIDKDGVFLAGDDDGSFIVTATAGSVSGSAALTVGEPDGGGSGGTGTTGGECKPGTLRWTGEVPTQKWMNFYTKVLSRYATGKGLKLCVSFEVTTEGGVSKQNVEETKTALKELGLNDDVNAS